MGVQLAAAAASLACSERTLRRYVNDGTLRGERFGRQEVRLSPREDLYLRRHWEVLSRLRQALRTEPSVRLAVLFGSTATGEDRPDSDVDLMIHHASADLGAVVRLQRRLDRQVGKAVHLVLREDIEQSPELLADVLREGRVIVDRGGEWGRLNRRRPRVLREAAAEEASTHEAAWSGVAEARARIAGR